MIKSCIFGDSTWRDVACDDEFWRVTNVGSASDIFFQSPNLCVWRQLGQNIRWRLAWELIDFFLYWQLGQYIHSWSTITAGSDNLHDWFSSIWDDILTLKLVYIYTSIPLRKYLHYQVSFVRFYLIRFQIQLRRF